MERMRSTAFLSALHVLQPRCRKSIFVRKKPENKTAHTASDMRPIPSERPCPGGVGGFYIMQAMFFHSFFSIGSINASISASVSRVRGPISRVSDARRSAF